MCASKVQANRPFQNDFCSIPFASLREVQRSKTPDATSIRRDCREIFSACFQQHPRGARWEIQGFGGSYGVVSGQRFGGRCPLASPPRDKILPRHNAANCSGGEVRPVADFHVAGQRHFPQTARRREWGSAMCLFWKERFCGAL